MDLVSTIGIRSSRTNQKWVYEILCGVYYLGPVQDLPASALRQQIPGWMRQLTTSSRNGTDKYLRDLLGRIAPNGNTNSVDRFDRLFRQNVSWRSVAIDLAGAKHQKAREKKRGEVEVVQRGDDRQPLFAIEAPQKLEDLDLMSQIEKSGRLVE